MFLFDLTQNKLLPIKVVKILSSLKTYEEHLPILPLLMKKIPSLIWVRNTLTQHITGALRARTPNVH